MIGYKIAEIENVLVCLFVSTDYIQEDHNENPQHIWVSPYQNSVVSHPETLTENVIKNMLIPALSIFCLLKETNRIWEENKFMLSRQMTFLLFFFFFLKCKIKQAKCN